MDKPNKPSETLPSSFGGVKENFSASKISTGYQKNIRDILGGANLNYLLDVIGKKDVYHDAICDYINAIPINKTPVASSNNKLVYTQYDIKVYDATETYAQFDFVTGFVDGDKYIFKSLVDNNLGNPLSDTNYWIKTNIIGNGFTRNIGEYVSSTIPLTDSGLHLLDGALIDGNGAYSEFVDYMANLYGDGTNIPNYFTTETSWQTSVTTYGVCGKFVYNSTNNTIRLPKITGLVEGTIDATALGDLVQAGLPQHTHSGTTSSSGANHTHDKGTMDITGTFPGQQTGLAAWWSQVTGAFYKKETTDNKVGQDTYDTNNTAVSFSAKRSWTGVTGNASASHTHTITTGNASDATYGRNSKVQPQTIKCFLYIVISSSAKTSIEVDIDEIATDLNGKADTDGSNFVTSVKNFDGQWVFSYLNVIEDALVNSSSSNLTFDLSSYLPNDNYKYEVMIRGRVSCPTSSGKWMHISLSSDIMSTNQWVCRVGSTNNETNTSIGGVIIPVGTGRTITQVVDNNSDFQGYVTIQCIAYRRIGTNA